MTPANCYRCDLRATMLAALHGARDFMEHYKATETPQYVQICEAIHKAAFLLDEGLTRK